MVYYLISNGTKIQQRKDDFASLRQRANEVLVPLGTIAIETGESQ